MNDEREAIKKELEALRDLQIQTARQLEARNAQFESLQEGVYGFIIKYGLWLTGITYLIAGIRLNEITKPAAFLGINFPTSFWIILYSFTLISATYLWFKPRNELMVTAHWAIPTFSLMFSVFAAIETAYRTISTGQTTFMDSLVNFDGAIGNALFVTYILAAQYAFLRLSVLLKGGKYTKDPLEGLR